MFMGKAEAYPKLKQLSGALLLGKFLALPINIRLGKKCYQRQTLYLNLKISK